MLQIESANKGILIPRIGLTNTTDQLTIAGPLTNGTLIYNTTDNASLDEGFYYWQTNIWVPTTPTDAVNIYNSNGTLNGDRTIDATNKILELSGNAGRNALTIKRTDDEVQQGIAFRNSGGLYDASIFMDAKSSPNKGLVFASGGNYANSADLLRTMTLNDDRSIRFDNYGGGIHNGNAINLLGVDAAGNVVESSRADAENNIYNANGAFLEDRTIFTNDRRLTFRSSTDREFSIIPPVRPLEFDNPFIFSTTNAFTFQVDSFNALAIQATGQLGFGRYGNGDYIGTAAYQLAVEADGDVIEVPLTQFNSGLQYYSYNMPNFTAPPDIASVRATVKPSKTGFYNGNLNSTALTTLRPSNTSYFIIKVTGYYFVKNPGTFNFSTREDDGARIYVDGSLIVNDWTITTATRTSMGSVVLGRGKHQFEFWYFKQTGGELLEFSWGTNTDSRSGVINAAQFTID